MIKFDESVEEKMNHTNLTQTHSGVDIEKVPLNQEEYLYFLLVILAPVFFILVVFLFELICPQRPIRKEEILEPEEMLLPFHEQQMIINLHGSGI